MNILITGGTGFIGGALAQSLYQQGHNLTMLSRKPDSVTKICGAGVNAIGSIKDLKP